MNPWNAKRILMYTNGVKYHSSGVPCITCCTQVAGRQSAILLLCEAPCTHNTAEFSAAPFLIGPSSNPD
jgi:hypothetical protein